MTCHFSPLIISICTSMYIPPRYFTEDNCVEGDVRLVGGSDAKEGWVEICMNNTWGIVCNDGWSDKNSQVVCKQLGLKGKVYTQ